MSIVHSPLLVTVGWAMLHFAWQACVIAGALRAYLHWSGARAAHRGRAATIALVAMALAPAISVLAVVLQSPGAGRAPSLVGEAGIAASASPAAARLVARVVDAHRALAPVAAWVAVLWLAASTALVLGWLSDWRATHRLTMVDTHPGRRPWRRVLDTIARRLGVRRPVTLIESPRVDGPMLIGVRRPTILVPPAAIALLTPRQAAGVLAHELEHVRRGDYALNLAQSLVEALLVRHPAVVWVSALVRDAREHRCDDAAIALLGGAHDYVRALARLEAARGGLMLALAVHGGSVLDRVRRIVEGEPPVRRRGVLAATSVGVAFAVLVALGTLAVPGTSVAAAGVRGDPLGRVVIRALDPAGPFVVTMRHGRVTSAEVAGIAVPPSRIVQRADSVWLPWSGASRTFALHVTRGGTGVTWHPRSP